MTAVTPEIVVLTHFVSPYQVDLFDHIERLRPGALRVYYLRGTSPLRHWSPKTPAHSAFFLDHGRWVLDHARRDFGAARFAVFNYYVEGPIAALLAIRAKSGKPWSFWGERPGYRYPAIGRLVRRWKLRQLHASQQPIWGIGNWAVKAYRDEFGDDRDYVNLPYFSDLAPLVRPPAPMTGGGMTFLYSGALSARKGVDLLARAFKRLAQVTPTVHLKIMGNGSLETELRRTLADCHGQVEWIGFKDWHELAPVYASAHVLCVPSRYDGWGLVVPEGLAAGLPVIGTDRTGAALELITPGHNGWLVPAADEDALYDCLTRAAALDEPSWRTMSNAARAAVSEHTLANGAMQFLAATDPVHPR